MMIKFVNSGVSDRPAKRKQTQRACSPCRKRKKRCTHDFHRSFENALDHGIQTSDDNVSESLTTPPQTSRESIPRSEYLDTVIANSAQPDGTSRTLEDHGNATNPRFLGHTNPEGMFLAVASPAGSQTSSGDAVGFWLPPTTYNHLKQSLLTKNDQSAGLLSKDPFVSKVLLPYLQEQYMTLIPDNASLSALKDTYEKHVHPIFPIIPVEQLSLDQFRSDYSPAQVLLIQSLCLTVAMNPIAKRFLRLPCLGKETLSPQDFASNISQAMLTSLNLTGNKDKLVSIRALTTLSLFSQLSNDDHISAEYCARAVSHVQTLQLHLSTSTFREDHAAVTRLFLCVWAVDHLNAIFHGRPVLMHDRDFGRIMSRTIREQDGSFRLFLNVVGLLERVLALYRPHMESVNADDIPFPTFEDMVIAIDAETIRCPAHILCELFPMAFRAMLSELFHKANRSSPATIETLYHAVAMLSSRFDSLDNPNRSSTSYLRQSLSAVHLMSLLSLELETRSAFPFVPYAISLSLRVWYREVRLSRSAQHQRRATAHFRTACTQLAEYRNAFDYADRMTTLAEKLLQEMDKVARSLVEDRGRQRREAVPNERSSQHRSNQENSILVNPNHQQIPFETPISQGVPDLAQQDLGSFDFDFDDPTGLELFQHFDADFNLGSFDLALAQNIRAAPLTDLNFATGSAPTPAYPTSLAGHYQSTATTEDTTNTLSPA